MFGFIKTAFGSVFSFMTQPSSHPIESSLAYLSSALNKATNRSYSLLKTWTIVAAVLVLFSLFSVILYSLLVYSIMPVPIQESVVQIYKDHTGLVGITSSNFILEKQKYKIHLKLNLPEDEVNYSIGNFETSLNFLMKDGRQEDSRNIGIMKYHSPITRSLKAVFCFPLIMLGLVDEAQDVIVEYSYFIENPKEIKEISVRIRNDQLRVNSMSVVFEVQLSGIKWFMNRNKISSFLLGSGLIFLMFISSFLSLISIKYEFFGVWQKEDEKKKEDDLKDSQNAEFEKREKRLEDKKVAEDLPEKFDFSSIIKPVEKKKWY